MCIINSPEPKVKVFIPMYEPLEVTNCQKCGKIIAEPKELIRIQKKRVFGLTLNVNIIARAKTKLFFMN